MYAKAQQSPRTQVAKQTWYTQPVTRTENVRGCGPATYTFTTRRELVKYSDGNYRLNITHFRNGSYDSSASYGHDDAVRLCEKLGYELI